MIRASLYSICNAVIKYLSLGVKLAPFYTLQKLVDLLLGWNIFSAAMGKIVNLFWLYNAQKFEHGFLG